MELVLVGLFIATSVLWITLLFIGVVELAILLAIYYMMSDARAAFTGAYSSEILRAHPRWKRLAETFSHRVVVLDPTNTHTPALFACHPHGICSLSVIFTFAQRSPETRTHLPIKQVHIASLPSIFRIPVVRDLYMGMGCVNYYWSTIESLLQRGNCSVALIPGGVTEMGKDHRPEPTRDERFLKRAYTSGIDVIPVYCHNEDAIYRTWKGEWKVVTRFRSWMAFLFGYPFPTLFLGPWPWAPLVTYIGLTHQRSSSPVESYEHYAKRYWESLERLKERAQSDTLKAH